MEIVFAEPLPANEPLLYLGQRQRYPSVTDVVFVSSDRIVVAHRYACKLYYIELVADSHRILDEIVIYNGAKKQQTEMMDIRGSTLYLISYTDSLTLIDIVGDSLKVRSQTVLNKTRSPYHGIQVHGNKVYITPSNKAKGDDRIIVWNTETDRIDNRIQSPDLSANVRIKDITFLTEDRIVILGNYKTATPMTTPGHVFDGFIGLYTGDFRELHTIQYAATQFDSVVSKDGTFYATGSDLTSGYIYVGSLDPTDQTDRRIRINKYPVQDFPHGISICANKLAYTSYTTSAVYIVDVSIFS